MVESKAEAVRTKQETQQKRKILRERDPDLDRVSRVPRYSRDCDVMELF